MLAQQRQEAARVEAESIVTGSSIAISAEVTSAVTHAVEDNGFGAPDIVAVTARGLASGES